MFKILVLLKIRFNNKFNFGNRSAHNFEDFLILDTPSGTGGGAQTPSKWSNRISRQKLSISNFQEIILQTKAGPANAESAKGGCKDTIATGARISRKARVY